MVVRRKRGVLPRGSTQVPGALYNVIKLTAIRLAYPCVVATATRAWQGPLGVIWSSLTDH